MLEARDLYFAYRGCESIIAGATLSIRPGQVIGLHGQSGCGKSTFGRLLAGYLKPGSGTVRLDVQSATGWSPVQYVHQSSIFSVNPRWRIGHIIEEGWTPDDATREALGVAMSWYDRFPHEISGGELQRVTLLRALSPQTRYLVADEVTAMLDPITQAEIWHILRARCRRGLGILAISHDASLLDRISSEQFVFREKAPQASLGQGAT